MFSLIALAMLMQAPAAQEVKPATLEGTVTHAASHTAIRKAKVTLALIGGEQTQTAETGEDGKYTLKDVKPGRYRLSAEKAGYQATAYGAKHPGEALGQTLRIDAGAALAGLDIAVAKQGVIAGKITDNDGEPVAKALVLAMNSMYANGKKVRLPAGTLPVLSNDLGEYRIGQLPPGKFIVCAVVESSYQPQLNPKDVKTGVEEAISNTCFPSVATMTEATAIEIKDAAEVPGIDIHLNKVKTVTFTGEIAGVPPGTSSVTYLSLVPKDSGPMGRAMGPRALLQGADGKFTFKNVPPGSYVLQTLPTGLGNTAYVVKSSIEIGEQPIEKVTIQAAAPFEVKGHLNAEPSPELKVGAIKIVAVPADDIVATFAMSSAAENGDFVLGNLVAGRYRLAFTGMPGTHYVKEIKLGEKVVEGDEADITNAATPVTISLGLATAEVGGVVQNDKGEPVPSVNVGLVPNPKKAFRVKMTRTDQNGLFKLPNVAPGEYLVLSLDQLEAGALEDEEFLKPLLSKAKKVTVRESGPQNLELQVIPSAER
ncbi:carboxypeptidase-like regulatory domain-containing protein [uncultured Paludibaculum sp.]|uniref:carboxypeptidase-like regulatory domain-containing protein n=1 Tax=uncultured Paludibaculum sp. TaxID=1765020 RepID=UPI002AAA91AC|nr:carboxypeptidase-like regulatory domain-containing protein [uncultured Paludibaculum sp.]